MPSISTPDLTLSESNGTVTIRVEYVATFTPVDRQLAGMGVEYHAHTSAHGVDGSVIGARLVDFPRHPFAVTVGTTNQVFNVFETQSVPRVQLNEDPFGDPDEIKVQIRIHSPLPPIFTDPVYTDLGVLTSAP